MDGFAAYLLLVGAGCIAGTLNVIAGGGSFLTLPILIFLGLPASVANGTNRVGILIQNAGAVVSFRRHRLPDWHRVALVALPAAALGALLGTWMAVSVPDLAFQRILAFLMVGVTLWTLIDPVARFRQRKDKSPASVSTWILVAGFFFSGVYGGFVQAGVGFLILTVTTLAGLDMVRGNAVKVAVVLVFTVLSLAIFAWNGKVDWISGLCLGIGTLLGGQVGVHLTVLKGHRWVKGVVTAMVILFAIKLWFST